MFKTALTAASLALAVTFALPAAAQSSQRYTNPSLESYEGGHVAANTAFSAARSGQRVVRSGLGGQLASNPSIEGYSGGAPLNTNPRFGAARASHQLAAESRTVSDSSTARYLDPNDDFSWIETVRGR